MPTLTLCPDGKVTGLHVGYVLVLPGAPLTGETLDELKENLKEVIEVLLEDGNVKPETEFVGIQNITVG